MLAASLGAILWWSRCRGHPPLPKLVWEGRLDCRAWGAAGWTQPAVSCRGSRIWHQLRTAPRARTLVWAIWILSPNELPSQTPLQLTCEKPRCKSRMKRNPPMTVKVVSRKMPAAVARMLHQFASSTQAPDARFRQQGRVPQLRLARRGGRAAHLRNSAGRRHGGVVRRRWRTRTRRRVGREDPAPNQGVRALPPAHLGQHAGAARGLLSHRVGTRRRARDGLRVWRTVHPADRGSPSTRRERPMRLCRIVFARCSGRDCRAAKCHPMCSPAS